MKKILSAITLIASFASFAQNENTFTFNASPFINDATLTNSQILDNNEMVIGGYNGDAVAFSIETFDVLANTWTTHLMFNVPETPTRILAESVADTAYFVFNSTSGLVWAFAYHDQTVDTLMNGFDIGNFYGNPMDFAVSGSLQRLFFVFDGGPVDSQVYYYEYGSQNSIGLGVVGAANNLQNTSIFHKEGTPFVYVVGTDQNQADGLEISQGGAADATVSMITQGPITNFITTTQAHTTSNIVLSQGENDHPDVFYKEVGTQEMHSVYNSNSQTTLLGIDQGGPYDVAGDGDDFNQYILLSQSGDTYVVFKPHSTDEWDTLAKNTNYLIDTGYDAEQTAIDISSINARVFGSFGNNSGPFTKVFLTNSPPSYSGSTVGSLCENLGGFAFEDFAIFDLDFDSITFVDFASSDNSVINAAGIFPTQDGNSVSGTFFFDIYMNASAAGTTDITLRFTDGMDTIAHTETITVNSPASLNYTQAQYDFCTNIEDFDLNSLVDLSGGTFFDDGAAMEFENGIIDFTTYSGTGSLVNIGYSVVDGNGCSVNASAEFQMHDEPTVSLTVTNSSCGANSGEILAAVAGANGTYSEYWSNGAQNTDLITNLSPGGYYYNIEDDFCFVTALGEVEASDITVTEVVTNPTCHNGTDGSIDLTITGPNAPYTVLWSTGGAAEDAINIGAGLYQAVITNDAGCTVTRDYELINPLAPELTSTNTQPTCNMSDGTIFLSAPTNMLAPFNFDWSNGATTQDNPGISSGVYTVLVTDANSCEATHTTSLVEFNGPDLNGITSKSDCGANNGTINASIFIPAGDALDNIVWSHGPSTEDVSNLAPGNYTCTVNSINGCATTQSWDITAKTPLQNPICILTVDSITTTNLVVWEKVETTGIDYYNIYRENSVANNYSLIDTVHAENLSVFNDVVASPSARSWRYKISAVNDCGVEGPKSIAHKTVHLIQYTDPTSSITTVNWDDYEGFAYTTVDLHRYSNENGWEFVQAFSNTEFSYEDPNTAGLTQLDYIIEVTPLSICTATTGKAQDYNSSRSNKAEGKFNPGFGTGDSNNSLAESNENFGVHAYPNPNLGLFTLHFENYGATNSAEMKILDIQGRVITKEVLSLGSNQIDISNLSNGIYTVIIFDGEFSESLKVIKR